LLDLQPRSGLPGYPLQVKSEIGKGPTFSFLIDPVVTESVTIVLNSLSTNP
jgi:hypothetical protein